MFIDETWAKTNMAPLRGWAPCGERLKAKADVQLKSLINVALRKLRDSGRFDELVLRHFPARVY